MANMRLSWKRFDLDSLVKAESRSFCLYVFHHPRDGDHPFYIGKAKYFGPRQPGGYKGSARYNGGYRHLVAGLLRSEFSLYIAEIGEAAFVDAEAYEQTLIELWKPVRPQKIKSQRKAVITKKPWKRRPSKGKFRDK